MHIFHWELLFCLGSITFNVIALKNLFEIVIHNGFLCSESGKVSSQFETETHF